MTYKDEVLGKRVEVEFQVGSLTQFFPGTVQKLKMEFVNGKIRCEHFIMFDDMTADDEEGHWMQLDTKEKSNKLRWIDYIATSQSEASKKIRRDENDDPQFPIIVLKDMEF